MGLDFEDKDGLLAKLRGYAQNPDDDVIRYKEKIKQNLLQSPELLYALNNPEYSGELFNEDGTVNEDGDWSLYFGTNIKPYRYIPEVQSDVKNYLCYRVGFTELPRFNDFEKYATVTFIIYCDNKDGIDKLTGIPRHDLIASIIRERFNWSNIFGIHCKLISNEEDTSDGNYVMRTLVFRLTTINVPVKTIGDTTFAMKNVVRR